MLTILMGAMMSNVDAKWVLGDQKGASDIHVGDTIVLEFINLSGYEEGRFLAGYKESAAGILTDENIYVVEEGPIDIRTGAPTVYLKRAIDDPTREEGMNGYMKYNGGWGTISYTPDPANAANLQIISCGEDIPWSNTYSFDEWDSMVDEDGNHIFRDDAEYTEETIASWRNHSGKKATDKSVGFVYSTGENMYKDFAYLGSWNSAENIWFWGYTDTNQWDVYGVSYEEDFLGDLQDLIDMYLEEGEYVAGTDPGFYSEEAVNAYNQAMQEGLELSITSTDNEELKAMIDRLKAAHKALTSTYVPITEGYYYFVIAFEKYLNEYGHEKAAYIPDGDMRLGYKTFDAEDANFVFEVTKADEENEWWVQHLLTGYYVGNPTNWYGVRIPVTTGKDEPQNIRYYDAGKCVGKWFWGSHSEHSTSYCAGLTGTGTPADNEGLLHNWGQWADGGTVSDQYNCWYLRKITDQATIDAFDEARAQAQRTRELRELVADGTELYNKLFTYEPDYSEKLITTVSGGAKEEPAEDNQLTISTIRKQGVAFADKYEFLIDEDDTTYMQGEGYLRIVLKEPKQMITFVYNTRDPEGRGSNPNWKTWGANERPKTINLYGYNTVAGDTVFGSPIGTGIDMGSLPLPATYTFDFGKPVDRVAFYVTENANGGSYFTLSEFQMYEAKVNQTKSQYYTTEGLAPKADALNEILPTMREIVTNNTATDEDIQNMKAAVEAVKEMFADTTALAALIAESEQMLAVIEVGDEMGQLSDQALADALQAAITDARATAFTDPINPTTVKAAEKAVREAKAAFMAGIKSFEQGKWYFIVNMDTERTGDAGAEDAFCNGNAIYLNKNYADGSITKWGLFDEGSMSLNADNNPSAMWRFVPVEGTEFFAVQNLYTGYYLGDYAGDNINLPVSETPVPYEIAIAGNGGFYFYPRGSKNKSHLAIWPEGYDADVVCHPSVDAASVWTLIEVDPEEQEAISIGVFAMNLIDVMAVPFAIDDLAEYNEDVHTYAVKKMTQESNEAGEMVTTVELYEKAHFDAGEPCIIGLGAWESPEDEAPFEDFDLVIPFPTGDIVDHTHSFVANGIVGGLHGISFSNVAVSTGKEFIPYSGGFGAMTGVIDPATYRGEVEDVETAATLVIVGDINAISDREPADVNGDGSKNTADVVAVYTFIEQGAASGFAREAADVNGDSNVNTADVVAIYTAIIGNAGSNGFAKSGAFYPGAETIDGSDNVLTILVESTDDLSKIPVTLYLTNPTNGITAVEATLVAPVDVKKFVYDEEEEDFVYDPGTRWTKGHAPMLAAGTEEHGADGFFISIADSKTRDFKETEGAIITVYFDGSDLGDGDYTVKMKDAISVAVGDITYTSADVDAAFSIKDGKVTAVNSAVINGAAAAKTVYGVDGKKVTSAQKGQIYVIDGKTVKF